MNTDDLRGELSAVAQQQPPVSADLRDGVERRIRRQRLRAAAAAAPLALLVVLLGVALAVARSPQETSLATSGPDVPGSTSAPTPDTTPSTGQGPSTTHAPAPGPDATTTTEATGGSAPSAGPTSCGTVTLDASRRDVADLAPFRCLLEGFETGAVRSLTVVASHPTGGSITTTLTTGPDRAVTVAANGSLSMTLPAFPLPGGGSSTDPGGGSCGTITVSLDAGFDRDAVRADAEVGLQMATCLLGALRSGRDADLSVVATSEVGGSMTASVHVGADRTVTVSIGGTVTVRLPDHIDLPDGFLDAIPPGSMGLDDLGEGWWPTGPDAPKWPSDGSFEGSWTVDGRTCTVTFAEGRPSVSCV